MWYQLLHGPPEPQQYAPEPQAATRALASSLPSASMWAKPMAPAVQAAAVAAVAAAAAWFAARLSLPPCSPGARAAAPHAMVAAVVEVGAATRYAAVVGVLTNPEGQTAAGCASECVVADCHARGGGRVVGFESGHAMERRHDIYAIRAVGCVSSLFANYDAQSYTRVQVMNSNFDRCAGMPLAGAPGDIRHD